MNKKKIGIISSAAILSLGWFTLIGNNLVSASKQPTQVKESKTTAKKAPSNLNEFKEIKQNAAKINQQFYAYPTVKMNSESSLVDYPNTFEGLLNKGELTVEGIVTNLSSYSSEHRPYTIAKIKVKKVLKGNQKYTNQEIRVMFLGGNITKKDLLAPVTDKTVMKVDQKEAQSNEMVTVAYAGNRLPKAGDELAAILTKAPKNANGIPGQFWGINFAEKGVFFKEANGQFLRTKAPKAIGGPSNSKPAKSQKDYAAEDDEKMNSGMNQLIKSQGN